MEWQIVTVIIALVGLGATETKPIMNLTNTLAKLNHTCQNLEERMEKFESKHRDSHGTLWEHNQKQDEKIADHDKRISTLEKETHS